MLPITMRFFTFILVTITLFSNDVFAEFKEISKKEFLDSNLKALEKGLIKLILIKIKK